MQSNSTSGSSATGSSSTLTPASVASTVAVGSSITPPQLNGPAVLSALPWDVPEGLRPGHLGTIRTKEGVAVTGMFLPSGTSKATFMPLVMESPTPSGGVEPSILLQSQGKAPGSSPASTTFSSTIAVGAGIAVASPGSGKLTFSLGPPTSSTSTPNVTLAFPSIMSGSGSSGTTDANTTTSTGGVGNASLGKSQRKAHRKELSAKVPNGSTTPTPAAGFNFNAATSVNKPFAFTGFAQKQAGSSPGTGANTSTEKETKQKPASKPLGGSSEDRALTARLPGGVTLRGANAQSLDFSSTTWSTVTVPDNPGKLALSSVMNKTILELAAQCAAHPRQPLWAPALGDNGKYTWKMVVEERSELPTQLSSSSIFDLENGSNVALALGISEKNGIKAGDTAVVAKGPDIDGQYTLRRADGDQQEIKGQFARDELCLSSGDGASTRPSSRTNARGLARFLAGVMITQSRFRGKVARRTFAAHVELHRRAVEAFASPTLPTSASPVVQMQSRFRGSRARWNQLPKVRDASRRAVASERKKELAKASTNRRARVEASCRKMLAKLPAAAKDMLNFQALVDLKLDLEHNVVGLTVVKEWCQNFLSECLSYLAAGGVRNETRHILLTGELGTGKRRAATMIAKTLAATGHASSSDLQAYPCAQAVSYCVTKGDVDELSIRENGGVTILACRSRRSLIKGTGGLIPFIKREPVRLHLPGFTSTELAEITLRRLASEHVVPKSITCELVREMIEHKWSDGERQMRGIYIISDVLSCIKAAQMRSVGCAILAVQEKWAGGRGVEEEQPENSSDLNDKEFVRTNIRTTFSTSSVILPEFLGLPSSSLARALSPSSNAPTETGDDEEGSKEQETQKEEDDYNSAARRKQAEADAAATKIAQEAARAEVDRDIEQMIGMKDAKRWFDDMRGKILYVENGGNPKIFEKVCLNMCLTGNPGTGKTTLARLMFRFLRAYGILKKDIFVEMNALELKGQYVGHTAPAVKNTIRAAMGGALFLDEAYALAGNDGKSDCFSGEAIRTLLTELENNRTSVMCIVAGYRDKMSSFFRQDPGLPRRFPAKIHLADYTPEELASIIVERAQREYGMGVEESVPGKLVEALSGRWANDIKGNNAGLAVNLLESAVGRLANRVAKEALARRKHRNQEQGDTDEGSSHTLLLDSDFDLDDRLATSIVASPTSKLQTGTATGEEEKKEEDVESDAEREARERQEARSDALASLAKLVGMAPAKAFVKKLLMKVRLVERGASRTLLDTCTNLVLTGNPGVGKTTFARILHRVLFTHGVLREDSFVERNALQLKGQYVGQTTPNVLDAFAAAKGGTLFLDEFPALAAGKGEWSRDSFSNDAVRTLLTEIENNRNNVCVILAGYAKPMDDALDADPGLRRRFPHRLNLPDYSPKEMARIGADYAKSRFGLTLAEGAEAFLAEEIAKNHKAEMAQQNASLPIRLVEHALERMAERVASEEEELERDTESSSEASSDVWDSDMVVENLDSERGNGEGVGSGFTTDGESSLESLDISGISGCSSPSLRSPASGQGAVYAKACLSMKMNKVTTAAAGKKQGLIMRTKPIDVSTLLGTDFAGLGLTHGQ